MSTTMSSGCVSATRVSLRCASAAAVSGITTVAVRRRMCR
ncbi:hypothetical protein LINGRAHAP2_LOCUS27037 [Linum grandiflorum]